MQLQRHASSSWNHLHSLHDTHTHTHTHTHAHAHAHPEPHLCFALGPPEIDRRNHAPAFHVHWRHTGAEKRGCGTACFHWLQPTWPCVRNRLQVFIRQSPSFQVVTWSIFARPVLSSHERIWPAGLSPLAVWSKGRGAQPLAPHPHTIPAAFATFHPSRHGSSSILSPCSAIQAQRGTSSTSSCASSSSKSKGAHRCHCGQSVPA
jgi:hypothetical protein